jgi:hypothetical protein
VHWRRLMRPQRAAGPVMRGLLRVAASDWVDLGNRPVATSSACIRQAVSSLGCSSQMKKEREKGETAPGGGPRRDGPGGKPRRPAAGSSKGSKRKAPPPTEDPSDGESSDEGEEEEEDEAMQDAVSGSEDRFTDADEVILCMRLTLQLRSAVITCQLIPGARMATLLCTLVHWRHDMHTTAATLGTASPMCSDHLLHLTARSHFACTGCIAWCGG